MTEPDHGLSGTDRKPWERLRSIRSFARLAAILIGFYVCYLLALPFVPALAGALAVAALALPLQRRLERTLRRPDISAAACVVLLALLVAVPLLAVGQQLVGEFTTGLASLEKQFTDGDLQRAVRSNPLLTRVTALIGVQIDFAALFRNAAATLTRLGGSIIRESLSYSVTGLLTFYFLFYFLRDRRDGVRYLKALSPFTARETDRLLARVSDTIHAVVFGIVVTAAVQGALGGGMFWLLGLPNPLFWGLMMAVLAVIPVLGAFVIWIPGAAYLALSGEWGKAAVLTAWGSVVIGLADNLLYPVLAGGRLRLHTIPMFISVVGGLALFGPSGLILGPLAVTLTMGLLDIWRVRTHVRRTNVDTISAE